MTETPENPKSLEDLFAHRFSSEDEEYQQYLSRPADPPPIVEGWRSRGGGGGNQRGRDNRYQDRRGFRDRGWGGERSHHGQHHWHDRDRYRGHGSGYQSGSPGYNSHQQRPHYDRY
ncbi:RNMT-activating mini protein [Austrofundulus limnaeus]|uniref:RNMT-activating mini protein n=1 Tax=Austrofundulus limnaeus TaxID=52670 RepID=A0A2I4CU57_AUSLI|nr:PREDICTED: RNMT-activating mini protein [Austrofundulus limnaeus]XP_013883529.1 PREDICTED: RNMT-activating mini protein [Austrofundulus limnaeus]